MAYLTADEGLNRELTRHAVVPQTIITMYNRNRSVADNPLASWLNWAIDDTDNESVIINRLYLVSDMVSSSQRGETRIVINSELTNGFPPNVDGRFDITDERNPPDVSYLWHT